MSEYAPDEHSISNTDFLKGLGEALLALVISALILIPAFLTLRTHATPSDTQEIVISGNELTVILGRAKPSSTALELVELSQDKRAILSKLFINIKASDYPFVSYQITNANPGTSIRLLWRTAQDPNDVTTTPLYWGGDKPTSINMAKHQQWRGNITELGLSIYGDLRDQPLIVDKLTLAPYSWGAVLSTIWSEWTVFRGWDQSSINYLLGTPNNPILSPTVAAAAWAGLALLLLATPYFFTKTHNLIGYVAAILIPWISLDLLWQGELSTQLDETKYLFAGKTQHEKHLADGDADIYQYAQYLKNEVLPEPGFRLFTLHDQTDIMRYRDMKTRYYLRPHNSLPAYHWLLPRKYMIDGDYVLILGEIDGLTYSPDQKILQWPDSKPLPVTLIDTSPSGTVYKVSTSKLND